ncbi:cobalamin B12-binding domain-containing protein [Phytohabitans kaempferiae]|uniref:Cobalamin B12-binding domain-containing protein n=1 Tax=Phytohabitans kaempferiae TaxID=1620943 RepID=A0ABV6LY44_9ACTN
MSGAAARGTTGLDAIRPSDVESASPGGGRTVLVSSMASDSHTWNLVYLQLLINEFGFEVVNLGPCVPDDLLVSECVARRPSMVVLSSVNGHGYQDGMRVIGRLRERPELAGTPVVIGGKLGVSEVDREVHAADLLAAGFDAVYDDRPDGAALFRSFVTTRLGAGATALDAP